MRRLLLVTLLVPLLVLTALQAFADEDAPAGNTPHLSRYADGTGPVIEDGVIRLLDDAQTHLQSNAAAWDRVHEGAREGFGLRCSMRVLEGGDGGAFLFLDTRTYGANGPAPFLKSVVEPNLEDSFAVGIDVHNPPSEEMFTPWGNYQDLPQREVSLHWGGREIVKRVAPEEFRGAFANVWIDVQHVVGGAEVTVKIGEGVVYDAFFIAGMLPYEARPAVVAGTRADAATTFDVKGVTYEAGDVAKPMRRPLHVEVFHHVRTDNSKTAFEAEVDLPPTAWAFDRVILTLDIHDTGKAWDEWDRNGHLYVYDDEGRKLDIVPFITSYRTECHWEVDVTHFRPLLAGKRKFEIAAGTTFYKNRGYLMSVSLDYYHGTPALEPYRVVPVWVGTARYRSAENHFQDFFEPQTVAIDAETKAARLCTTTTGHSQIGEFVPSEREIFFVPDATAEAPAKHRYTNTLWKTDCYLNPNRPQFGTWQFSRAGWAPGDVVRPWWIDLTEHLVPGATARLEYEPKPYDFTGAPQPPAEKQIADASHVVRSYLILYRDPTALAAAPSLLVTDVAKDSNAAEAGVKAGDYLASYDGVMLDTVDDLRSALMAAAAAEKESVVVVVFRGTERHEFTLKPGRMGVSLGSR